ncbi:DUF11 domain-containing protein, partial [Loktanella sp. TSTF-M6]|nr:DUF11 domain-containing protein [Loktanella gaetbuli]
SDDGNDADGNTIDDPTELPIAGTTGLDLVKRLTTAGAAVGDTVVFTLTAENTGTLSLRNVTLSDTFTRADGTVIPGTPVLADPTLANAPLLPGGTRVWTLSHVLDQADVDAGGLRNTATVAATSPAGDPVSDVSDDGNDGDGNVLNDPTELAIAPDPQLEVTKVVRQSGSAVGETVIFEITAANLGNVTLRGFGLVDTLTDLAGNPRTAPDPMLESGASATVLGVGGTNVYTVSYVLTQTDIDAGGISNSVAASATAPDGTPVTDLSDDGNDGDGNDQNDPTEMRIDTAPALSADKVIVAGPVAVGETVIFDIRVTNTGNVTLRDAQIASDTLTRADGTVLALTTGPVLRSSDQGSPAGTLLVGETAVWRASYVLTQADIDAGGISNIAVATAVPFVGAPVSAQTRDADAGDGNPADDPTVLVLPQLPALSVDKVLADGGPVFAAVDDPLTFRFDVVNTGNVTLTDPVTINDPLLAAAGDAITCEAGPLAPGGALSCTGIYQVTQADIDAGGVTNTATAQSGATASAPDSVTVPAQQTPALDTVKNAVSITFEGVTYPGIDPVYFRNGAVVNYTFLVTNTGNTTITDTIDVDDNLVSNVSCPILPNGLAPGADVTCTASYTVTLSDVDLGAITNVATATAGGLRGATDSVTVPQGGVPSLGITKSLFAVTNPDNSADTNLLIDEVGDTLTYRFLVENTGTVSFVRDVVVNDVRLDGPLVCFAAGQDDFAPGEFVECFDTYVVTQDDLDAGAIPNEAVATTQYNAQGTTSFVTSDPSAIVSPVDAVSAITLAKSVATLPVAAVDQELTYTLTITNTGNQRLRSVSGTDPLLPDLVCSQAVLEPQAQLVCSDTYTVTQADVDRGTLSNTADVSALSPQGAARRATDTLVTQMPAVANDLQLEKRATVATFGAVGSTIGFDLIVTNNGNVTLTDLELTDPLIDPDYVCRVASLAPGATDASCAISRLVTQADVDAGTIENTAFVTGLDARGGAVDTSDDVSVPSGPRSATLDTTKTLTRTTTTVGETVTFRISLRNSGDVTLRDLALDDTFTRADGTVIDDDTPVLVNPAEAGLPLGPGETRVWTLDHVLTQADVDAGGLRNTVLGQAIDRAGAPVVDVSDDGNDTDGNTVDDPT